MSGPPAVAPVSGSPVPPWGLTAPPWSSAAPPQPLDRPGDTAPQPLDQPEDAPPQPATDEVAQADPGPGDQAGPETGDGARRSLPVYDELLEFPEPKYPQAAPNPQAYPEQGAWPVPAPFHQPPAYPVVEEPEPRGRNRTAVAVVVGAAVVAVVAVLGVGVVLLNRDAATPPPVSGPSPGKPKVSGPPPGDLRLQDEATTITVTWTDPTDGGVPFVVAGGRAGQKLGVMATVDPGETRYTVNGLSAKLDYCFTVLAVYSTDTYATSGQVCTDRQGGTGTR
ncbi:hypothetical protein [Micromonospora sp. NPDC007230]|uniref:fibronectin type III domain-containing protein n=1 Tax=Micromonospora sp. NPDC007230 TaxID=3364237 RepID=UPI00369826EC